MQSRSLPLVLSLILYSCASQTTGDPRAFIDDVAAPVGGGPVFGIVELSNGLRLRLGL